MLARTRPLAARAATSIVFILFAARGLIANPFIGTDSSPQVAPVLAGGPTNPSLIQGQLDLRQKLADYLGSWQGSHSASLLLVILGVSFLYGALHALGPGHRKTVVFSIYLARKAPWWEPMASSLALAGLHGGAAIVLLLIFRGVSGAISASTDSIATYMEGGAYTALIVMAFVLLVRAIVDLVKGKESKDGAMSLGTLILTGIYPCPGAILVLVLSLSLDIMQIGILAVLAMSLGMSVPIAVFAYLGWAGRAGLLKRLKNNEAAIQKAGTILEIGGFSLLLVFSVYLALPFIASVARIAHLI
jgi:nickel/cobalt transporter (NicO) family protein